MEKSRKKYDRERARKVYEDFKDRRATLLRDVFGGTCALCERAMEKGLHLHHVEYHPEDSNYPRHSRSMYVRLKRLVEAENHPERFTALCPTCHCLVESVKHVPLDRLLRLVQSMPL